MGPAMRPGDVIRLAMKEISTRTVTLPPITHQVRGGLLGLAVSSCSPSFPSSCFLVLFWPAAALWKTLR